MQDQLSQVSELPSVPVPDHVIALTYLNNCHGRVGDVQFYSKLVNDKAHRQTKSLYCSQKRIITNADFFLTQKQQHIDLALILSFFLN